jgi:hypothetical protein
MSGFFFGGWLMTFGLIAFDMARGAYVSPALILWGCVMFAAWAVLELSERNKP